MKMHATTLNGMLRCIALLVTLPSLLAAPIPAKNIDESLRASVVRIEVAAAPPNYLQPWQVGQQEHRRGSGFQIAGRRILTNHHVIEDAVDIRERPPYVSHPWCADAHILALRFAFPGASSQAYRVAARLSAGRRVW